MDADGLPIVGPGIDLTKASFLLYNNSQSLNLKEGDHGHSLSLTVTVSH